MLSVKDSKRILQSGGVKYTDEEVRNLLDVIYKIAAIDIVNFKTDIENGFKKSDHLH